MSASDLAPTVATVVDNSEAYRPIQATRTSAAYPYAKLRDRVPGSYKDRQEMALRKALERRYQALILGDSGGVLPTRLVPQHMLHANTPNSVSAEEEGFQSVKAALADTREKLVTSSGGEPIFTPLVFKYRRPPSPRAGKAVLEAGPDAGLVTRLGLPVTQEVRTYTVGLTADQPLVQMRTTTPSSPRRAADVAAANRATQSPLVARIEALFNHGVHPRRTRSQHPAAHQHSFHHHHPLPRPRSARVASTSDTMMSTGVPLHPSQPSRPSTSTAPRRPYESPRQRRQRWNSYRPRSAAAVLSATGSKPPLPTHREDEFLDDDFQLVFSDDDMDEAQLVEPAPASPAAAAVAQAAAAHLVPSPISVPQARRSPSPTPMPSPFAVTGIHLPAEVQQEISDRVDEQLRQIVSFGRHIRAHSDSVLATEKRFMPII